MENKVKIRCGGEEVKIKPLKKQTIRTKVNNPALNKAKEILTLLLAQGS